MTWRTDMNVFTGPNDLLHGDEHLEELEDWELRERFFNALRDLTEAADTVEKLKSPNRGAEILFKVVPAGSCC
jgi:hypothetical protein